MARVDKTITIHAPVDTIFGYVNDPAHMLTLWPDMVEVGDVLRLQNGGYRFRAECKVIGARVESIWEAVEIEVNEFITFAISGGMRSEVRWTFQPRGESTEVAFHMDCAMPAPLLRRHSEESIITWSEREAEAVLVNLKSHMEQHDSIPA